VTALHVMGTTGGRTPILGKRVMTKRHHGNGNGSAWAKRTANCQSGPTPPTARAADPKVYGHNRISNHYDLLPGVSGNSGQARRFRDLVNAYIADAGGIELCSEIRIGLFRRLAAATVRAEVLEARHINGEQTSISDQCALVSTVLRLSIRAGVERTPKDITPDLYRDVLPRLAAQSNGDADDAPDSGLAHAAASNADVE
jgi:hypothetical protein